MDASRMLVIVLVAVAALPASASAATVTKAGSLITYIADGQETNDVTVSLSGDTYTVTEQGKGPGNAAVTVKNGGGCDVTAQGGTSTATCPAAGTSLLDVETGNQADAVKILAPTPARLFGGDGSDTLTGGDGDDVLNGEGGVDTLRGGGGADVMSGGDSTDIADYSGRSNPLTVTLDGQPGDGEAGENDNVQADVEIVNGGGGADTITGSDTDNVLNGNGGNDTLNGQGGDDSLNRGDFDGKQDPGAGDDTLGGGAGNDSVSYDAANSSVQVTLDGLPGDGAAGENDNVARDVEDVTGGRFADELIGNGGPNVLQGGPGKDRLLGGGGEDTLDGGEGNDSIQALGGGVDHLLCDRGIDGVIADKRDVPIGCEVIERTLLQVLAAKIKMRKGVVRIPLRCSAYATDGCAGTLTLMNRKTVLGVASFDTASGRKSSLKVKLSKKGRKLFRKKRSLAATAVIRVKDSSGQTTKTTKKVKLTR